MNEIVSIQHRKAVTTSLKVADVFGKQHKHVLNSIEKLIQMLPEKGRPNFRQSTYINGQNKNQPMYEITRDGFVFLAMGFNGEKALGFKLKYIEAFNRMEQALHNQKNLSWQQQRLDGKKARRLETDTIARFVDYATSQGSTKAKMYFMQITKMTHQALGLVKQASPQPFRDLLGSMQLTFLTTAEYIAHDILEDGMNAGLHYSAVYALASERVTQYAATLPKQRLLEAA